MLTERDIVVVAWDGQHTPLVHIDFDETPRFHLLLFDYAGKGGQPNFSAGKRADEVLSISTEFKGKLIEAVCRHVKDLDYRYIGLLDDDQAIAVSGINKLLKLAEEYHADVFHPAIDSKSFYSHAIFLQRPEAGMESVDWIEIMAPFLRKEVFEAGLEFYENNISSYGIDRFVFPYLQRKLGKNNTYLVHDAAIRHLKPVTDGSRRFSNGLDARQEGELTRAAVLSKIKTEGIRFTPHEMRRIYQYRQIRWQKLSYDVKRFFGLRS